MRKALAPLRVAIVQRVAIGTAAGVKYFTFWSRKHSRSWPSMSSESFTIGPSVPPATLSPLASQLRTGGTPPAVNALLDGQVTTVAPDAVALSTSSSVIHTACAR